MKTFLVDTDVLLRYLLGDIPEQSEVVDRYLLQAKENKIKLLVPALAIVEAFYVLGRLYKKPKDEISRVLSSVINTHYISVEDRGVLIEALETIAEHNISFVDSLIMIMAKTKNHQLLTFDKKLQKLAESKL